jgi:hypothetical protein
MTELTEPVTEVWVPDRGWVVGLVRGCGREREGPLRISHDLAAFLANVFSPKRGILGDFG